jgi:putative colanic acid biosynthesis glycosyltransferase
VKVLFISSKLEGGAFNFIKILREGFENYNIESFMLYGYGKKGFRDRRAKYYGASNLTPFWVAVVNYFSHYLIGKEILNPGFHMKLRLRRHLQKVDVIHLNILHSFSWRYKWLLNLILESKKPVVWTMHDQWIYTGRCAIPGKCEGWRTGCNPCQDIHAYPPSKIDCITPASYLSKNLFLKNFSMQPQVRIVGCAIWISKNLKSLGFGNVQTINNGIEVEFYQKERSASKDYSFLFVSRYLDSRIKGSKSVLEQISEQLGNQLTIVGDLPSERLKKSKANLIPYTSDKSKFRNLLLSHQTLIFLSEVDTYSLLALEALASGMQILGLESNNLIELGGYPNVHIFRSPSDLLSNLQNDYDYVDFDLEDLSHHRMIKAYLKLYKSLIGA